MASLSNLNNFDIKKEIGNAVDATGTFFNLPEMNLSEKIAGGNTQFTASTPLYQSQQNAANDKAISDIVVNNNKLKKQQTTTPTNQVTAPTNQTTNTGSNDNTGSGGTDYNSVMQYWQNQLNNQNSVYQQMMEQQAAAKAQQEAAAKSAYDEVVRQANQYRDNTQKSYDTNTSNINSRYDTLAQRIADSINNLETNKISAQSGLENNYQSAKAQEYASNRSAERQNRNLARAMNRGDSSFYEDIMTENDANTASALDALMGEKSTKNEDLFNNYTQSKTSLDNQAADSEAERANMMQQALDEYNAGIETAKQLEAQGLIDYNSAVAGLQSNLANNYLQIASQQQSGNLNSASILAAMQGALGNLGAISTSAGVDTTISDAVSKLLGNQGYLNQIDNTGNADATNLLSMSNKSKTKQIGEL